MEFPAYFDGGLTGVRAREAIAHKEIFVAVPHSVLLSIDKAWESPLKEIFQDYEAIFGEDATGKGAKINNSLAMVLTVFVMYER